MLIELRVENHRSLRDEQVLTLEAGRVGDGEDRRPRQVVGYPEKLLPVAALYGANASGKSNVLAALRFMRDAVVESQRAWAPDDGVPRDPFAFGPSKEKTSLFEVTILVDDVRYEYAFAVSDDRFIEEWLYAWPHGKKQVWFERDENGISFGDQLKGENRVIEGVTRPNALFLSAAVQLKHVQLLPIFTWFSRLEFVSVPSRRRTGALVPPTVAVVERLIELLLEGGSGSLRRPTTSPRKAVPGGSILERFRMLLSDADFGIVDLRVNKGKADFPNSGEVGRIQLKHQGALDDAWLPLAEESSGTQMLFEMGFHALHALERGGVIVVDELEASLHPMLGERLVHLFNDPRTNPNNAQLIFTTHDTNLLGTTIGEPALRRDQVWLTEKSAEGATTLYPLTDYKPRKAENIERGYLQGRFGGVPYLGSFFASGE